ncbi:uncharacterized protein LOC100903642 [Galendromus occidentalis]|uniref:Urease n=1 Tax=Galendromus occidentalis TaxID=34638 RepID=A0AAJ7WGU9_9ACAR|nr:uncharacterized protein LOC100903642 [Galendromus occidentalis]
MIDELSIEACFDDGTKLVCLHHPICENYLPLEAALYGSFVEPISDFDEPDETDDITPGEVQSGDGTVTLNENRVKREFGVTSTCDRPIQIGSHYPFIEANPALIFDRARSYGMRLDIAAGMSVRFEPGDTKRVRLVEVGGLRKVFGGNGFCGGKLCDQNLERAMAMIRERGFGNANDEAADEIIDVPLEISRSDYAANYGPTVGDLVRLGDTDLYVEVEKDMTSYGDEVKFGGGKVIRDGMGQCVGRSCDETLDLVLTNALIIDAVLGIVKADIGINDSRIVAIGKAGNPDIMDGVHPKLVIGAGTEVISAEGKIVTAGAIDCHTHFTCPQLVEQALHGGVTTLIGGGTGPAQGSKATTCTPGIIGMRNIFESCDAFPINFGFTAKGNCSSDDPERLAPELEEQIRAGAMGMKLHEDWGSTPAAIDSCLRVAEKYDVQVMIHTDTLNESGCVENTLEAFKGRTIHAYHAEGAGGGHAPDIITVCGIRNVIPSSTNPTLPYTRNTMDEVMDMLLICHHLDKWVEANDSSRTLSYRSISEGSAIQDDLEWNACRNIREDLAFAESRMRAETVAAEDVLHDLGAISCFTSDSHAMGRMGETVSRTWQTAHKMKQHFARLPEDSEANDNFRVKRYIAKYTINPAIANGIKEHVGSVEQGKFADLVLWHPAFFGVKPEMVIKGGQIILANSGSANASIPTAEPYVLRSMFGACGSSVGRNSLFFVSSASISPENNIQERYRVRRQMIPVKGNRSISKADMLYNDHMPSITVDPETYEVAILDASGERRVLWCDPIDTVPLSRRYFLF